MRILLAVTQVCPLFLNFEAMRSSKPAVYFTWMRILFNLLAVTQVWPLFLIFEAMRSSKPVAYLHISYLDEDSVGCDAGLTAVPEL